MRSPAHTSAVSHSSMSTNTITYTQTEYTTVFGSPFTFTRTIWTLGGIAESSISNDDRTTNTQASAAATTSPLVQKLLHSTTPTPVHSSVSESIVGSFATTVTKHGTISMVTFLWVVTDTAPTATTSLNIPTNSAVFISEGVTYSDITTIRGPLICYVSAHTVTTIGDGRISTTGVMTSKS